MFYVTRQDTQVTETNPLWLLHCMAVLGSGLVIHCLLEKYYLSRAA